MRKLNNNLILCEKNGQKHYFTSGQKAAEWAGVGRTLLMYYIGKDKLLKSYAGDPIKVSLVDGSEIKYKDINN